MILSQYVLSCIPVYEEIPVGVSDVILVATWSFFGSLFNWENYPLGIQRWGVGSFFLEYSRSNFRVLLILPTFSVDRLVPLYQLGWIYSRMFSYLVCTRNSMSATRHK